MRERGAWRSGRGRNGAVGRVEDTSGIEDGNEEPVDGAGKAGEELVVSLFVFFC